jgi:hypothetical protein
LDLSTIGSVLPMRKLGKSFGTRGSQVQILPLRPAFLP